MRVGGLPDFDQMTVGIADVTAGLVLMLLRWRQDIRARGRPFRYAALMSRTRILKKALTRSDRVASQG
jgi:hypothetical protein